MWTSVLIGCSVNAIRSVNPFVHPFAHSRARNRTSVRSHVNMKMWPRFQFVVLFFSVVFFFLCVFNHSQLIIETSVGLNGLCACLTYFKMYLQIKGRPNHRSECWCVLAHTPQSNRSTKKRKTFVVNNFDVNRLVAEFNQKRKRKKKTEISSENRLLGDDVWVPH